MSRHCMNPNGDTICRMGCAGNVPCNYFAPTQQISDFKPGDAVRYVPHHAHGDINHKHCENGIVSSTNDYYVFVRYGNGNPKATSVDTLVRT